MVGPTIRYRLLGVWLNTHLPQTPQDMCDLVIFHNTLSYTLLAEPINNDMRTLSLPAVCWPNPADAAAADNQRTKRTAMQWPDVLAYDSSVVCCQTNVLFLVTLALIGLGRS